MGEVHDTAGGGLDLAAVVAEDADHAVGAGAAERVAVGVAGTEEDADGVVRDTCDLEAVVASGERGEAFGLQAGACAAGVGAAFAGGAVDAAGASGPCAVTETVAVWTPWEFGGFFME